MSITTPQPGVRLHPNGRSWQVRISPFKPRAGFATVDEANEYAVELNRRKRLGILVPPDDPARTQTTLADAAREHLERLATVGGRRGTPYSPDGLHEARKACRPWTGETVAARFVKGGTAQAPPAVDENGVRFADTPLPALRVRAVEAYLEQRAATTARAAAGEAQALQRILQLAARRGETFDHALLTIESPRRRTRKRRGLEPAHLDYLIERAPEHQRRLLRLCKTLGNRIGELLNAEDAWFDLDAGTVTIPAWACKERREKALDLLPEEIAIVREQRLARSPQTISGRGGTPITFPRAKGTRWTHCGYWNDVVHPVRRKAARDWRAEHRLADDADTPFEWKVLDENGRPVLEQDGSEKIGGFAPHDLRRSAADLLRRLDVPDALIAARFGHADQGQLIAATYAADDRRERLRAQLDAIAADGGTTARLAKAAGA